MRNLIENALRASAERGGRVEVRIERLAAAGGDREAAGPHGQRGAAGAAAPPAPGGGEARIVVSDRGPGVEPALLGRIFDPYFSTHDSGTGLGLPIARRIVEEHGGAIHAHNRAGGGLEVAITIPL